MMAASIPKYRYQCLIVRWKTRLSCRNFVIAFEINGYDCLNHLYLTKASTIFFLVPFAHHGIRFPHKLALNINIVENRPPALPVSCCLQSARAQEAKSWFVLCLVGSSALSTAHPQAHFTVRKGSIFFL